MDFDREIILASFLVEAEEGLNLMEQALVEVETNPSDHELLHEIFRVAHTIKGNASSLELTELAGFAHVVEDLLEILRSQQASVTPELISLLLKAVDAFRALVPAAAGGNEQLTPEQLLLRKTIAKEVQARAKRDVRPLSPQEEPIFSKAAAVNGGIRRTLRADIEKLDSMLNLTGEIVIAQGRLRRMIEELKSAQGRAILEMHNDVERLYLELQEQVMQVRMVPVGPMFRQLVRSVRDISRGHEKNARLEVADGDVEVDTTVLEHLKDPLLHMIRNAIDHGIESPHVRQAHGKNPCGVISLSASHSAGNIVIEIKDDGAGFNRTKIAEKAKKLGLVADPERLRDQELFRVVFEAGFSTADAVTDLSGRGVGMDVVRRNIDELRGAIDVASEEGKGTTITIRLPLTLAIIEGFSVTAGDETFIVPLEYVTECVELTAVAESGQGSGIINLRDNALPYVRLRDLFGTLGKAPERENVLVVKSGDLHAGIAVDNLLGATQAVIKPLGKVFQGIKGISGSTILGDGRVGLIIDVPGLLREVTKSSLQPQVG